MFDSQQYLFKPFIYQFTTVPFKTFIYRLTTLIKYDLQNLQNLEFPKPAKPTKPEFQIPFKPLSNSQWYMFLNQFIISLNWLIFINNHYLYTCMSITICIRKPRY